MINPFDFGMNYEDMMAQQMARAEAEQAANDPMAGTEELPPEIAAQMPYMDPAVRNQYFQQVAAKKPQTGNTQAPDFGPSSEAEAAETAVNNARNATQAKIINEAKLGPHRNKMRFDNAMNQFAAMERNIDRALELNNQEGVLWDGHGEEWGDYWTNQYPPFLPRPPFTQGAHDQKAMLDQVNSALSVQALQRMRQENKTGGGVGNVALGEMVMLAQQWSNQEIGQSREQLNNQLLTLKELLNRSRQTVIADMNQRFPNMQLEPLTQGGLEGAVNERARRRGLSIRRID